MLDTVLRSWKLLRPKQKVALASITAARSLTNLLDVMGIVLVGLVGALALDPATQIPLVARQSGDEQTLVMILLVAASIVFVVKTAVGIVLYRLSSLYLAKIETSFSVRVSHTIFGGIGSDFRATSQPKTEWMILRSTNVAFSKVLGSAISFIAEISLGIAIFAFLFATNWLLALVVTGYFSFILLAFQLFSQRIIQRSGRDTAEGSIDVHQAITDLTNSHQEIRVLAKTSFFLNRLETARYRVARGEATDNYLSAIPRLVVELGLILGAVGLVVFQLLFGAGAESLSILGIFLMGSLRMMSALLPLQRAVQAMRYFKSQAASAQEFLAKLTEIQPRTLESAAAANPLTSRPRPAAPHTGGLDIRAEGVSFSYATPGDTQQVLENISLNVVGGSSVAIIGPSGSGKSTLLKLILGLLSPTSGQIECDGYSPEDFRLRYPGKISYVPQKPGLVSGTIEENVALGISPEEIDRDRLWQALRLASLSDLVESLPDGPRTSVGAHADSLSGGQVQRLGLARAFYTQPRLIVLDEATSALDAETEASVTKSFAQMKNKTTLIVVAHRLSTVQSVDEVHVLDEGKFIASGSFQSLRRENSMVKRYVDLMSFLD